MGMIIGGRGTATEFLKIFAEKHLYKEVNEINSKIKETPFMLNVINSIDNSTIGTENAILVVRLDSVFYSVLPYC